MAETVRGLNIKLALDGKDLDNELKEIKQDLKEQQKDLRAINTNLKYDSSNLDLWKDKQTKLNEILQTTKKRLEVENAELEKARKAVQIGDISEAEFKKLERNVSYTEAEIKKLNNQLETTKDKITSLGNANFEKIGKIGDKLTKSVTLPVLGAVSALGALAIKSANTADELADTSSKIGLSVEALQEWNHTATLMGVSTQDLNKAFVKVNGILGDIATGNITKVSESLSAIGLSIDDLKGKNTDEVFLIIRDALASLEDETLRVGIANEFFGDKIGSEILPILSAETSSIVNLRNEAKELGIITTEQTEITGLFNDTLDQVKESATALSVEFAVTVLPMMQSLLEKVRDEIIPTIRSWIEKWNSLDSVTKELIVSLGGAVVAIGPVLSIIGKVGPILNIVISALKGVGTAGILAGTGINFATLGIGALISILAVALLSNEQFRDLLVQLGETLMMLLAPIMDIIKILFDALQPILTVIIDLVMMIVNSIMPIIIILLQPFIDQIGLIAMLFEAIAPLIEILGNLLQAILVPAIKVLYNVLQPVLKVVQKIVEFIAKIFEWIGGLGEKLGDVATNIGDTFKNVTGNIGNFAIDVTKGVGGFVDNIKNKTGGFFSQVGSYFGENFNLKQNQANLVTNNASSTNTTTNNITIQTTSSTFDIDSINRALGGNYI